MRRALALADRRAGLEQRLAVGDPQRLLGGDAADLVRAEAQPGARCGAERSGHRRGAVGRVAGEQDLTRRERVRTARCRSAGIHQAVSNSRFGWSAATRQIQDRSQIPAWARIRRASGNSPASSTACRPSAGIPRPAWIRTGSRRSLRQRDDVADLRVVEREVLRPRVELDPAGSVVQAALGLADGRSCRGHAAERDQQPIGLPRRLEHHVVGRRIAARARASGTRRRRARAPCPAARAAPRAVCFIPSGSFCPRWVWASNSSRPGTWSPHDVSPEA